MFNQNNISTVKNGHDIQSFSSYYALFHIFGCAWGLHNYFNFTILQGVTFGIRNSGDFWETGQCALYRHRKVEIEKYVQH